MFQRCLSPEKQTGSFKVVSLKKKKSISICQVYSSALVPSLFQLSRFEKKVTFFRLRCSVISSHDNSLSERGLSAGQRYLVSADLSKKVKHWCNTLSFLILNFLCISKFESDFFFFYCLTSWSMFLNNYLLNIPRPCSGAQAVCFGFRVLANSNHSWQGYDPTLSKNVHTTIVSRSQH